jgi:hypothetical protein
MNRREFLLFSRRADQHVVELSCERLYMQFGESQLMEQRRAEQAGRMDDVDLSSGEPPAVFDQPTVDRLFADLERRLRDVDVLRLVEVDWLTCADFRARVESLCAAVQARGGRIERPAAARVSATDR